MAAFNESVNVFVSAPCGFSKYFHRLIRKRAEFEQTCTLLFDLSYLAYGLFKDGTFVWFDIEAVDVAKVGRNQFGEFLDVFALLFPPAFITPVKHTISNF